MAAWLPSRALACVAEWRDVEGGRGVFILVHGLNNSPEAMRPLATFLNQTGFATVIVALTGHRGEAREVIPSRRRWVEDLECAVEAVQRRWPGKRMSALGFSLGGAVILNGLSEFGRPLFERVVLVAPAIGLKGYTALLRPLTWLDWTGLGLPSFIPPPYRAEATTPLTAYAALFDTVDTLLVRPTGEALRLTPTLVLLNDGDEFISVSRTRRFIQAGELAAWQLEVLPPLNGSTPTHLMLDPATFGAANWERASRAIRDFISPP